MMFVSFQLHLILIISCIISFSHLVLHRNLLFLLFYSQRIQTPYHYVHQGFQNIDKKYTMKTSKVIYLLFTATAGKI